MLCIGALFVMRFSAGSSRDRSKSEAKKRAAASAAARRAYSMEII